MKLANLTPHDITLQTSSGERIIVERDGRIARVASVAGLVADRDGIPVPVASPTQYGEVEGLPDPEEGTVYIVSGMVLAQTRRPDVFAPGTGPQDGAIRTAGGQIEAVTRLIAAV